MTAAGRRLAVEHPNGRYDVVVGAGALALAQAELTAWVAGRTLFVVTAAPVWSRHGDRLAPVLAAARHAVVLEVADGEACKSIETALELWRRMVAEGGKRDSRLLTFGGGSVGDLGGFVAGAFLRGITFVQAPTTLLAQVDASVGGKTGVDLPEGKNTVGLFHQPDLVVADTAVLSTLPLAELRAGLAESIKMGFLLDAELFEAVENRCDELLAADSSALAAVVAQSVVAKAAVVGRDPYEQGERRLLNFGHTLGHAIETALGYDGLRHGEAVALGMLFALDLAESLNGSTPGGERLRAVVARLGLPVLPPLDSDLLIRLMARDKKATEDGLGWVLPERLGRGCVRTVPTEVVRATLSRFLSPGS